MVSFKMWNSTSALASKTFVLPSRLLSVRGEKKLASTFCSNKRKLLWAPQKLPSIMMKQRNRMMILLWILIKPALPREITKIIKALNNNQTRMRTKTQLLSDIKRLNRRTLWKKYWLPMRISLCRRSLASKMTLNGRTSSAFRHASGAKMELESTIISNSDSQSPL